MQYEISRNSRTKRLSCTVDVSVELSSTAINWYRQKPGEAFERILFFPGGALKATIEPQFSSKFIGSKTDRIFSVTISRATEADATTYYCALWRRDTVPDDPLTAAQKRRAMFLYRIATHNFTNKTINTLLTNEIKTTKFINKIITTSQLFTF